MNLSQLQFGPTRQASSSGILGAAARHRSATPRCGHVFSRRRFLRSVAGAAVAAVILCSTLLPQARADASDPTPIPGGNYFLGNPGPLFHVFVPGSDPTALDLEPITITDFDGLVGLAFISGMVTETNTTTGEQRRLPFNTADMRFMQGVYLDANGQVRQGTFALV